jgi:hypothetical protein
MLRIQNVGTCLPDYTASHFEIVFVDEKLLTVHMYVINIKNVIVIVIFICLFYRHNTTPVYFVHITSV